MNTQAEVFALISVLLEADEKIPEGEMTYTGAVAQILAIVRPRILYVGRHQLTPAECVVVFKMGITLEGVRDGMTSPDEAAAEISNEASEETST